MKKFTFILSLVLMFGFASGQGFTKVGTSSAQFLKFSIDARSSSLGGTHSGIYGDVASLYWNPAGIAAINRISMAISYLDLYVGIKHSFLGVVFPARGRSAIGLSAIMLDSGEIEQTTISRPEGTGAKFNVKNYAFGLSYGRYVTGWLMMGASIKYIREEIWNETAQAVAFDIGSVLETGIWGMKLGMNISNFGTDMKLEGQDLLQPLETPGFTQERGSEFKTESWPLPWTFQAGIAVDIVGGSSQIIKNGVHRATILGQYNEVNDAGTRSNFGVEYQWKNTLSARIGYYDRYDTANLSFGLGASFKFAGRRFDLDYALVDYDKLDLVHQYTLVMQF